MKVVVSSHDIHTGSALPKYIEDKINLKATKLFGEAIKAEVHFKKQGGLVHSVIAINDGHSSSNKNKHLLSSTAESHDIYAAFDLALDKLVTQLRKHKAKLKDHHKKDGLKAKKEKIETFS